MSAKKVTAFVGSARKGNTHRAVMQFLSDLQASCEVECEVVSLSDYKLMPCRGCQLCIHRGEEFCPLKDDRDVLMDKIAQSDGVIFASPNYCGDVSGIMKTFLDRFAFLCHRPRYFGKACTSVVTQSIAAGDRIVEYLDTLATTLGFSVAKGSCITAHDPSSDRAQRKLDRARAKQVRQFQARLESSAYPAPSWLMLAVFRMGRNVVRQAMDSGSRDYAYYADKGWFGSDYYYPTRLNPLKKVAGKLIDRMAPTLREMLA